MNVVCDLFFIALSTVLFCSGYQCCDMCIQMSFHSALYLELPKEIKEFVVRLLESAYLKDENITATSQLKNLTYQKTQWGVSSSTGGRSRTQKNQRM